MPSPRKSHSATAATADSVKVMAVSCRAGTLGVSVVNRANEAQSQMAMVPIRVARRRAAAGVVVMMIWNPEEQAGRNDAWRIARRGESISGRDREADC